MLRKINFILSLLVVTGILLISAMSINAAGWFYTNINPYSSSNFNNSNNTNNPFNYSNSNSFNLNADNPFNSNTNNSANNITNTYSNSNTSTNSDSNTNTNNFTNANNTNSSNTLTGNLNRTNITESNSTSVESSIEKGGTIQAGTYRITKKINISGSNLTINAPGVIIDGSGISGDAITISGNNNTLTGISVTKASHNGICITGKNNTVKSCQTYTNGNTGLNLKSGASNTLINSCKSYDNYDKAKQGEDADGFGVKAGSGSGNKFVSCESYNNSDDGWDFWDNNYGVTLEDCYAHDNGRDVNGDGNGFKLGSKSTSANHILINCTAENNKGSGITQNGNTGTNSYTNCISNGNLYKDIR